MATAEKTPLTFEVGEYVRCSTTVKDPAGAVIPDLSGYRAYIRYAPTAQAGLAQRATLEYTTENGGIEIDGDRFRWEITPTDSRKLRAGDWQMYVISPGAKPTRIYEGPVVVSGEILPAQGGA